MLLSVGFPYHALYGLKTRYQATVVFDLVFPVRRANRTRKIDAAGVMQYVVYGQNRQFTVGIQAVLQEGIQALYLRIFLSDEP